MDPSYKPPTTPPQPPGFWVTLDGGKGAPPAWGYVQHEDKPPQPPDHGLGGPPVVGGGPATPPPPVAVPAGGAPAPGTPPGHWVPVGIADPKGGDPTWAFVPEIGKDYGVKQPGAGPK
jgi:hypothetical protein